MALGTREGYSTLDELVGIICIQYKRIYIQAHLLSGCYFHNIFYVDLYQITQKYNIEISYSRVVNIQEFNRN